MELGAEYVVDSSAPGFADRLAEAIEASGARLGFDAIGGGALAGQILAAMERVAAKSLPAYNRYGSNERKKVYIYGALDLGPTILTRSFGFSWEVAGWLLTPFLMQLAPEESARLRQRVADRADHHFRQPVQEHPQPGSDADARSRAGLQRQGDRREISGDTESLSLAHGQARPGARQPLATTLSGRSSPNTRW